MGFVTPALLGGALFVALPIALHLIMRREAQKLRFPALRFVQQRRTLNQHRLRLRHLLLLALRCAVIALLAFALARPTLRGSGATGKEDAPVASVFVFDNSMRMEYQHANQTRLDAAKELAAWLLGQLPADGLVTIVDRGGHHRGQDLDRSAAELRIERLESSPAGRPMQDALRDALRWLEEKPDHRAEIYVFTDLAAEAWPTDARQEFARRLDQLEDVNVYLIDVGAVEPHNLGIGALELSDQRIAPGGVLQIRTDVFATAAADGDANGGVGNRAAASMDASVELFLGRDPGSSEKRGQQQVALTNTQTVPVEFSLAGLDVGSHQGYVRLVGGDGLPADDVRYFTVDVQPPWQVLLLGESPADALFLREALAPSAAGGGAPSPFACITRPYKELATTELADFAAVCLIDPPPLPADHWKLLADYVESGNGLGVFLGRRARSDGMNAAEPQRLLPTRLRWTSHDATFLRPVAVEHPALARLRGVADVAPWPEFPVFKYWELEADGEPAHVVAPFANGQPALVERQIGRGRVLMMTTPVSDYAYDDPWNLLPTASDPWPFLALANGIAEYLCGADDKQLNHLAGQAVVLQLSPAERVSTYVLHLPDGSALRQSIAPNQSDISIATTEALGNYRVQAGGREGRLDRGFSINLPPEATRLERVPAADLIEALGKNRTRVARTTSEIELRVGLGRVGRELYPGLIIGLALVLAAEQFLANRFYNLAPALNLRFPVRGGSGIDRGATADIKQPVLSTP